jgi:hypothetical protein
MAIQYLEKGIGLHAAIVAAGHWLEQRDGAWVSDDDAAVQSIIDGYTIDQARQDACNRIIAFATGRFNVAVAAYSPGELAGWPILRAEADAYTADQSASIPNITSEAQIRGCDIPTLVQKVQANASYFDNLRAQIAGTSGKHRDAVAALDSFAAVLAYDYSTGWPGV